MLGTVKNSLILHLILSVAGLALHAQSVDDFDRVVNFSVTLKQLQQSIDSGRPGTIDPGKFLLLEGTLTDIAPKRSWFFIPGARDVGKPELFIQKLRSGRDAFTNLLRGSLSQESRALLAQKADPSSILKKIAKDLGDVLKKKRLFDREVLSALPRDSEILSIASLNPRDEEAAYLNRLLLDHFYSDSLAPVEVVGSIVTGEWVGFDDVKRYECLVRFVGPVSFRIFNRRRERDASAVAVPENSQILIVVIPESPVKRGEGRIWLTRAVYLRRLK
jgi:hypothetical protein